VDTSAVFRQNNEILYSAPILRGAQAKQKVTGEVVTSEPADVIDINHNGKADCTPSGLQAQFTEPAIVSPKLDKLEAYVKEKGAEVVTQNDLPEGVFVSDQSFNKTGNSDTSVKPLNTLVNDLTPKFDPNARYALDFNTNEMLVYKPAPGGVCKDMVTTPSGLQYGILQPGTGDPVKPGQLAAVQYTGWLENGTKFDSSLDHGSKPFIFQVGAHNVIAGWDEGVAGMQVGEKRKLVVPANLGYGDAGAGDSIPSNSTLIFDVQLLADKTPDPPAAAPAPAPSAPTP
jgi:FKBP-type peptidyl-prolyl cis-trans isomerase